MAWNISPVTLQMDSAFAIIFKLVYERVKSSRLLDGDPYNFILFIKIYCGSIIQEYTGMQDLLI